ncbi:hypothetical protein ASPZODRAFT_105181 [Penicilliopsis zonata CBS 506.65]|uniref:Metallo-beta-lactamase domain-containing protein n=1 Tax=Penicilliopsis zonata CBS 506.65 TaxID=1073090 RepID=A0A1L9S5N8_9EURO|nr:hypothetical protein ASPZODRAFT_105181 [Penicilliopsis zonata CBS 506.65]OJJ42473.1 hypothetical protein ASPZODRAFT_105181 [Penicilliopsis zonata CBS 506.65]
MITPTIYGIFEATTYSWQYIVADMGTMTAAIVDPVLDYNRPTRTFTNETANSMVAFIREVGLRVDKILETHVHEDHVSAASYLQQWLAYVQGSIPPIYIGGRSSQQAHNSDGPQVFPREEYRGAIWKPLMDHEVFSIGRLRVRVVPLPGHSPHHIGYQIGDNILCGDSILNPDLGTARCDLPGSDAQLLFESCQQILSLPDHVRIWPGHDYLPAGRSEPIAWTTVGDQKQKNKSLRSGITKEEFVRQQTQEDLKLAKPEAIYSHFRQSWALGAF